MRAFKASLLSVSFLAMFAIGGCAATIDTHGNFPEEEQLSQLAPGMHKVDVAGILGTPSTVSAWDDDEWYYIGYQTESFAFFKPEELNRKVVSLAFNTEGNLQNMRVLTQEDGTSVTPVARETPTSGNDFSLWEQLVGNIGRFQGETRGGFDPI